MTYSLIACDDRHIGVATASHWVAVGTMVPWADAGVGAVATQAFTAPAYGPALLGGLRTGGSPEALLAALLDRDPLPERRQVAVLASDGRSAWHSGAGCLSFAVAAKSSQALAVGNMLASDAVAQAMVDRYDESAGTVAERLLQGLVAGQRAGGDARGRQAAALRVVERYGHYEPGDGVVVDVRVDDHADPITELARLARMSDAAQQVAIAAFPPAPPANPNDVHGAAGLDAAIRTLAELSPGEAGREADIWLAYYRLARGDEVGARAALKERPELLPVVRRWVAL